MYFRSEEGTSIRHAEEHHGVAWGGLSVAVHSDSQGRKSSCDRQSVRIVPDTDTSTCRGAPRCSLGEKLRMELGMA